MEHYELLNEEINGKHSYLVEYYKECKRKKLPQYTIGHELTTQLEKLIVLMQDDDIFYDIDSAHKRINFIESKCKHSEAPFAGHPFILLLWQKAFAETLFAFKVFREDKQIWIRKYQEALLLVGRKNGKTPFISALSLAEWFCGEMGQKIMCASNNYEEAALVWDAINNMREESPSLEKVTRKNNTGMYFGNRKQKKTIGKFTKQNKGSIKKMSAKGGAKEGRNLKIAIVDEVHEMLNDKLVMPLRQSLSTQLEPLYFEITTEGTVDDGYLDERLKFAREVLAGEREAPYFLPWLYTMDSEEEVWHDKNSWFKANPSLVAVKDIAYIEKMIEESKSSPQKEAMVLSKDFNIKTNNGAAWLKEVHLRNKETVSFEEFKGYWCVYGCDLSETTDLTALTILFIKPGTNKKFCKTMYFIPSVKAETKAGGTNREEKDYLTWAKEGRVIICDGPRVEKDAVFNYMTKVFEDYDIRPLRWGYDEWNADELVQSVKRYFGNEVPTKVKMDFASLNDAMNAVQSDLYYDNLVWDNNPITRWCLKNTSCKTDPIGRHMPLKLMGKSENRIDGALSIIIAYAALDRCYKELKSRVA